MRHFSKVYRFSKKEKFPTLISRFFELNEFLFSILKQGLKTGKNLTGYGYGLERKIKNSFGYIAGYKF